MPTLYNETMIERAYRACLLGATDETLAKRLGVSEPCVQKWYRKHPEFREAVKRGKRIADDNLVRLAAQGATFGWADELAAGMNALTGYGDYAQNVATERARTEAFANENPLTALAVESAGGLTSGGAGAAKATV